MEFSIYRVYYKLYFDEYCDINQRHIRNICNGGGWVEIILNRYKVLNINFITEDVNLNNSNSIY